MAGDRRPETELYAPVRDALAAAGYEVRAEVEHCDVAATRDGELIVVELKRGLSLRLLAQAARRQRAADAVYVAVPRPANRARWLAGTRDVLHLLRRLELGLLFVAAGPPSASVPAVEAVLHPVPFQRARSSRARRAVLVELGSRSVDLNRGGSSRTPLVTAYRENAVHIASVLAALGPSSPAQLRSLGTGPRTLPILSANVYGWFERIGRGVYRLAPRGRSALGRYPDLAARYTPARAL